MAQTGGDRTPEAAGEGPARPESRRDLRPQHARGAGRRRRVVLPVVLGLLVVVLGGVVWLAVDAMTARNELQAAAAEVATLQEEVLAGERDAAEATLARMQEHADAADRAAHGPHWSAAGALPWVGPHVTAVQTVAEVVDALATDALPGLMDATDLVDPAALAPVEGRVDLAPLQAAAPTVVAAHRTVEESLDRVKSIDTESLLDLVAAPVADLEAQVRDVAMTTATAARAVQLLPPMLGADGPREYLLLVQNNAEPRALGGMPGAVIHLRAEDGRVEMLEQRSASGNLAGLPEPALPLTDVERSLFGEELGIYMADVTFTPDYPRAAAMAKAIWEQQIGGELDGILTIDTGTLALVLGATGPVALPAGPVADAVGGALTTDNAVEVLNNTVYRLIEENVEQDLFYGFVGASVFDAVASGAGDPVASVDALAAAARQDRLLVWSAHEDEQALMNGTVLSGELRGERGESPVVGLYVNDGSRSKIGYYLDMAVDAASRTCSPADQQQIEVTVTLTSTAPDDAADLPPYISGGAVVPAGHQRVNLLAYGPAGGVVEDVQVVDGSRGGIAQIHDDLQVVGRTVELAPGESVTINYSFMSGYAQPGTVVVRTTPLAQRDVVVSQVSQCS